MKKKAIEAVPYLKLRRINKSKSVKFIGVTAVKIISHEKHLFLEIYKNEKAAMAVPVIRIVLEKKDFGTYYPEKEKWTRQKVANEWGSSLSWDTESGRIRSDVKKRNILSQPEDLERIKKYCNVKIWSHADWWEYVERYQSDIVTSARVRTENRKYQRRMDALHDRMEHTANLPKKRILKWADDRYFKNIHHLYYKKHGAWVQIACSHCGGVTDARWKKGISYESQFQRTIPEPREGEHGSCPMCGVYGQYKCQGKVKNGYSRKKYVFLGQRYKDSGFVMRYIEVSKAWILELIAGEDGTEMHGAYEEISGVEVARAYFEPGKDLQIDYQKHDCIGNKDYWDDRNLSGINNIEIKAGSIMTETYEAIPESLFRYSALKEYAAGRYEIKPIRYLERYQQYPQLEMLTKLGLSKVVDWLVDGGYHIVENRYAKRPDQFLGVRAEHMKLLISKKGDLRILRAMRIEECMNMNWSDEQIVYLVETGLETGNLEIALRYMSLRKLLNRIKKYSGCEYGSECSTAAEKIRHTATTYTDYLRMRAELEYDLSNTVYQYPRDLNAEHQKMVTESNTEKAKLHLKKMESDYPNIRKNYRSIRNRYFYEDGTYIIRPARSAAEIVEEGRLLHHCVGSAGYLSKHNNDKTYILMLRFRSEPDVPYITIEISPETGKIIQWYGIRDTKPDKEVIDNLLKEYLEKLRSGMLAAQSA